jgi:hypothetical protein
LRFGKYLRAHHFTRAGLIAAGAAAALVFFVLGAAIRLLVGPVSLGPFSGTLADALSQAMPGLSVKYDQAAVEWSRDEGRVGLVILGARVFDADGRIIAQAPKAAIDLSARSVFSGHPQVKRITLIGVQLTLVRTLQGGLRLGVGSDIGERDFLTNITDAITATNSKTSSLQAFAVRDARVAFLDQVTGLFVVAPHAEMTIATSGPRIAATLAADIEVSGRPAHVSADLLVPPAKGPVSGDLDVTGLDVGALGANAKMFAVLKGIGLNVDLSSSFTIDHGAHLSAADFGMDAHGTIGLPGVIAGPVHVKSVKLVGRYDGQSGRLLLDEGTFKSDQASMHLIGGASLKYDANQAISAVDFDTTGDSISIHAPGTMQRPISFRRLALRGAYLPATREIVFDRLGLDGGPFTADATAKVSLASGGQSAAVDLKGTIAPLSVSQMLDYWPLTVGTGARDWISHNFSQGHIGVTAIEAHVPAGAFDQPSLPDGALQVSMPISGGEINYLTGLTHLTQVTANTVLHGNSYEANVVSAKIGVLAVSNGHVSIPNFSAPGSPADVSVHIDGTMPDVLALLDMKPLNYPTRFGVSASDTKGNAGIDLSVHLPLIKDLSVDQVAIGVKSHVTGFDIALGSRGRLQSGTVDFDVTNDRMIAQGNGLIATSNVALTWNENFKSSGANSTQIHVHGTLDDAAREALALHTSEYLKGPVGVDANLNGRHGRFETANIALDLTGSTVAVDLIGIEKPAGTTANGQIAMTFWPASTVHTQSIKISSQAGTLTAQFAYDKNGALQSLSLPDAKYGPADDFTFNLAKSAAGTEITIRGRSLDGSTIAHAGSGGKSGDTQFDGPYHISAKLDRMVMREGVQISQLYLDAAGVGPRLNAMSLSGSLQHGATVSGSVSALNGARHLNITTDDAGQLARGLFGLTSMKGGKLDVAAVFPQSGPATVETSAPDFEGKLSLRDTSLTNQPLVARLLSVASFAGLFQGSGLQIDHFDVPFSSKNGVISVHDAAASGPTIGVTADGYIDRPQNVIAMKGSLVPVVGIDFNKVLGAIPLVGNILVSKKGEGMFGVTYSMSGSADQPSVSVNPLAMLTPGILRRLFQGRIPNASQAPTNNAPPPAASAAAAPPPPSPAAPPPAKPQ